MIYVKKADFDRIGSDYKGIFHDYHGERPEWKGRRVVMSGCITKDPKELGKLLIEGVHFLVEDDYDHLPALHKSNARVGEYYKFAGGCTQVLKIYRLSDEEAKAEDCIYLDRVKTDFDDFALPGSDLRSDMAYYHKINGGKK